MTVATGAAQHIGSREQQQDSFGFSEDGKVAVVADGMGGMYNGQEASQAAVKAFLEAYNTTTSTEPLPDALHRSHLAANEAVYRLALTMNAAAQMGTTLVAVAVDTIGMHWISTGDSGIFLYRHGRFSQVNHEHTYAAELDAQVERGLITRDRALQDPEREALTAYVGMEYLELIDRSLRPLRLRDGDIILLASDGLFKTLSFSEMAADMHGTAQRMSEALVERTIAVRKPYQDNITVVAITIGTPPESVVKVDELGSTARMQVAVQAAGERDVSATYQSPVTTRRLWIAVGVVLLATLFACVLYTWRNFQTRRGKVQR